MTRRDSRRARATAFGLAVALAVSAAVVGGTPTAGAQVPPPVPAEDPIEAEGVDPVLDEVPVDPTDATRRADDRADDAQQAEDDATLRYLAADRERLDLLTRSVQASKGVVDAEAALATAEQDLVRQEDELVARRATEADRLADLEGERDTLRLVVGSVFTSRPADEPIGLGSFEQLTVDELRQDVRDRTVEVQSDIVEEHDRTWREARGATAAQRRRVGRAEDARDGRADDLRTARQRRDDAQRLLAEADASVAARRRELDEASATRQRVAVERREARLEADVEGLDVTLVGIHAYWRAAAGAPCDVPWWMLAGVGKVESGHGTAQGSSVQASGDTTKRILGIALDGRPGVAAIGDSDGGLLDGDGTWDRAVGPMQFIPGTWRRWAGDGNGDDRSDPHNLYDAAAAAANYLCFGRSDLTVEPAMRAALLSYNRSVPYGTKVLSEGRRYRDALDLPDLPPDPVDPAPGG